MGRLCYNEINKLNEGEIKVTIETIKSEFMNAKKTKESGDNYRKQSFINYIKNFLNMNIVSIEKLGDKNSYKDEFEIVATRDNKTNYTFIGKHYDFSFFMPRENCLILTKVIMGDKMYECEETFYMSHKGGYADHFILNKPIDELIDGVSRDKEIELAVNALKEKLSDKPGYYYLERSLGDVSTFLINLNNEDKKVFIGSGFQNTIQVDMETKGKHYRMDSFQIHFRNKDVDEKDVYSKIESLSDLIDDYFNDTLTVDGNNISTLINSLGRTVDRVNTDVLIDGLSSLRERDLKNNDDQWASVLYAFQIENWDRQSDDDEYSQFEACLEYSYKLKKFKLKLNYLFNEYDVICDSVESVIETIDELKGLIESADI